MVVDHPGRLHDSVQDRTAAEFESAGDHVFTHRIRDRAFGRDLGQGLPAILDRFPIGEAPQIRIQSAKLLLNFEDPVGVIDDGVDFGLIADDPRVGEQFLNFHVGVAGDNFDIKIVERMPKILPLAQDRIPTQASLHPVQSQEFKQHAVIMQRFSPLFVMIAGEEGIIEIPLTTVYRSVDSIIHRFILL